MFHILKLIFDDFKQFVLLIGPVILVSQVSLWIVYCKVKRNTLIDFAWVLNHWLVGALLATNFLFNFPGFISNSRNIISLLLLNFWFLRLGSFLFNRIYKGISDPRYDLIIGDVNSKGHNLKFLRQYINQGCITLLTTFPLYYVFNSNGTIGFLQFFGWILAFVGIVGEYIADDQLTVFKETHTKGVLRDGLWKKSRHPNLFFELVTWFGFAFSGIQSPIHLIGFSGPAILYLVMAYLTVPLTEKMMKRKRGKLNIQDTNAFWIF